MATTNINGFNINGNNTSPDQFGHFMRKLFTGNVAGMAVSQNGTPNMTVSVSEGVALLTKNTTSSVWAEVKSATSVNIATADTSNPRIDTVIVYEDTSVSLPTTIPYLTDGGGGRFKLGTFSGTAAASPTALSDATIQSTIGAGKPWTRLADVTVAANTTTILNSNISDKRTLASAVADGSVTSSKLGLTKSTDANGWTVYDYGTFKRYNKRVYFSMTKAHFEGFTLASTTYPSGMSGIGSNYLHMSASGGTDNYGLEFWHNVDASNSTTLVVTAENVSGATRAYTGYLTLTIETA